MKQFYSSLELKKEILYLFLPFHIIDCAFLLPKYKITPKTITPLGPSILILSLCASFTYTCAHFFICFLALTTGVSVIGKMFNIFNSLYCVVVVLCILITNIIYKSDHVKLISNLQRNLNILRCDGKFWIPIAISTWLRIFIIIGGFNCMMFAYYAISYNDVSDCFVISQNIIFDATIIYTNTIFKLLNYEASRFLDIISEDLNNPAACKIKLQAYKRILKVYETNNKIYQPLILLYVSSVLASTLMFVQYILQSKDDVDFINKTKYTHEPEILSSLWTIDGSVNIFLNSKEYQTFYNLMRDINVACLLKMNHYNDTPKCCRRFCKSVLRLNSGVGKFEVYGLFVVDMRLTISVLAVLTSHVVVLLQFALL